MQQNAADFHTHRISVYRYLYLACTALWQQSKADNKESAVLSMKKYSQHLKFPITDF